MENVDELDGNSQLNLPCVNTSRTSDYATNEIGGESRDNSTLVEMLTEIKRLMDENHQSYHTDVQQISEENNNLKQRVKETEFQIADTQIRLVDFETRLITVEDSVANLGKVLTELMPALNESFVEKLNKRTDEIRDESRRHFVDNFSKLLSALESLEKRVEYIEVDLQFLTEESNKGGAGVERRKQSTPSFRREQSTPISFILREDKFDDGVQSDRKNSLGNSNLSKRKLPTLPVSHNVPTSKPVKEPPKFDGKSSWEAFLEQFEIVARMNGWNDDQSSVLSDISSRKCNIDFKLSNMSPNDREDYAKLVMVLSSRFGITHQSDLARAKLKTRIKRREEKKACLNWLRAWKA